MHSEMRMGCRLWIVWSVQQVIYQGIYTYHQMDHRNIGQFAPPKISVQPEGLVQLISLCTSYQQLPRFVRIGARCHVNLHVKASSTILLVGSASVHSIMLYPICYSMVAHVASTSTCDTLLPFSVRTYLTFASCSL